MAVPIVTGVNVNTTLNCIVLSVTFSGVSEVNIFPIDIARFGSDAIQNGCLFIILVNGERYNQIQFSDLTGLPYANNAALLAAFKVFVASVSGGLSKAGAVTVVGNTNFTLQSDAMTDANALMAANPTKRMIGPVNIYRNTTAGKYEYTITWST